MYHRSLWSLVMGKIETTWWNAFFVIEPCKLVHHIDYTWETNNRNAGKWLYYENFNKISASCIKNYDVWWTFYFQSARSTYDSSTRYLLTSHCTPPLGSGVVSMMWGYLFFANHRYQLDLAIPALSMIAVLPSGPP